MEATRPWWAMFALTGVWLVLCLLMWGVRLAT